jgi:hypothetical protein
MQQADRLQELTSVSFIRPNLDDHKQFNEDNRGDNESNRILRNRKLINNIISDMQYEILLHMKTHRKLEKTLGGEVYPALRRSQTSQKYLQADIC